MFYSSITDSICTEAKCDERLCEIVSERWDDRMKIVLCCVVEHWQDVVHLDYRFGWNSS
jgi:hypothetical protein